ncbi:ethylene-responsive nuclear protein / ethylene-regulated nuclear protein (ERT2) [Trifolium repens]|nr:ethylene-responsive nuclear protein / ethylene-regulated nuclear protein (ERT2) [Trifolium repens]
MPFLWKKKNRVTRISQIVADFQSPKRTSSLVVQTGFPTSLIDLFVKNRNRFKKSSFKKPFRSEIIDPSSSPSPPPPPPPSPVTFPQPISESPIHEIFSEEVPMSNPPISEIAAAADESAAVDFVTVNKLGSTIGSNSKMITVKMLTVIFLAASVKELTVAITESAFALLFLENALKIVVSNIKPKSRFQKVLFRSKENEVCEPVTVLAGDEIELLNLDSNLDSNYCVNDEIEVVEEKNELENSLKIRGKGNRSGRFKATMVKKLQKFRGSKKEKKEEKEIINIINKENISCVVDEEKEEVINIKNEVRDDECGITCSKETIVVVGNSSYAILVMVVLVGLIVGRLHALILTIGWCFFIKIVGGLWRSKSVGFIKGYVSRYS